MGRNEKRPFLYNGQRKRRRDQEVLEHPRKCFMVSLVSLAVLLGTAADPADWKQQEAVHLKNIRQVTSEDVFARAGEGYFSPDGRTIIFQAEEKGSGNPFYQIFTMDLGTK